MIRDLSQTLLAILTQSGLPTELAGAQIVFDRPTEPFPPGQRLTVNLFLYDVRENVELRSNEPIITRNNGQAIIRRPPLRVACSYLVTAWAADGLELALQEHRLLSQVLQVLSRYPTIPAEFLRGSLVGQEPPLPMVTALVDPQKNLSEFWAAVGNKLRPSFTVTVTVSVPVFAEVTGDLVTTRFTGFGVGAGVVEETLVQIGGQVLSPQVNAVRVEATILAVIILPKQDAVTVDPNEAAQFRPGDTVLLEHGKTNERAVIDSISGATITFQGKLASTAYTSGDPIRIADLIAAQRTFRLTGTIGIEPGTHISLRQGPTTESAVVQSVDRINNFIALAEGITKTYTMVAAADPVTIAGGIVSALVDIVDAELRTRTDTEGRYSFPRVPVGPHTIRVVALGFEPQTQPLVVPGRPGQPEDYDITLTPL